MIFVLSWLIVGLLTVVGVNYFNTVSPYYFDDPDAPVFCAIVTLLWPIVWLVLVFYGLGKLGVWLSRKICALGRKTV